MTGNRRETNRPSPSFSIRSGSSQRQQPEAGQHNGRRFSASRVRRACTHLSRSRGESSQRRRHAIVALFRCFRISRNSPRVPPRHRLRPPSRRPTQRKTSPISTRGRDCSSGTRSRGLLLKRCGLRHRSVRVERQRAAALERAGRVGARGETREQLVGSGSQLRASAARWLSRCGVRCATWSRCAPWSTRRRQVTRHAMPIS